MDAKLQIVCTNKFKEMWFHSLTENVESLGTICERLGAQEWSTVMSIRENSSWSYVFTHNENYDFFV